MTPQADYQATEVDFNGMETSFSVLHKGADLGRVSIGMPGMHNVYNALAAIAVAIEMEIPFDQIQKYAWKALAVFREDFQVKR